MGKLCEEGGELGPVFNIAGFAVQLLLLGIPILLVIFGLMDLGKAVMAGKDDEIKSAQKMLIKRIIITVFAFLLLYLITAILSQVEGSSEAVDCLKRIFVRESAA